ncbi:MAG: hypothetical protein F4X54_07595 [Chloroflexi bacterium]|nr:hypothetical protein [Chloroflexota bacterium]
MVNIDNDQQADMADVGQILIGLSGCLQALLNAPAAVRSREAIRSTQLAIQRVAEWVSSSFNGNGTSEPEPAYC